MELQQNDVYIGRGDGRRKLARSMWANPYKVGKDGTREQVVRWYGELLEKDERLLKALPGLAGKRLRCTCPAEVACHGDAIIAAWDRLDQRETPRGDYSEYRRERKGEARCASHLVRRGRGAGTPHRAQAGCSSWSSLQASGWHHWR